MPPADKPRFTIQATASRLEKGFIAVPQKFGNWFPAQRAKITVAFDDERKTRSLTFHPHDPAGKENRIFGTKEWFSRRAVVAGDVISVAVEDAERHVYRIILDRFPREKRAAESRRRLAAAPTDSQAEQELSALAEVTGKRPKRLAREELLRIAQLSLPEKRLRVIASAIGRHEAVPPGLRVLLRELHEGRCQLCSFTFEKRDGEPYFEIHHLDASLGHHPSNLLVICPNCHAQFEHALVTNLERVGVWLVAVTINGRRVTVRQPFLDDSARSRVLAMLVFALLSQIGRMLVR